MSRPTISSPFLDILPSELRLHIYMHLLVTSTPLKGTVARGTERYNLHTSILATNQQINSEARAVFFGRNIFHITSLPSTTRIPLGEEQQEENIKGGQSEEEGSGAIEPPLQLTDLPLLRHLEIDLLYYPKSLTTIPGAYGRGWRPVCVGAERYVASLTYVVEAIKASVVSLKLCADTRRSIRHQPDGIDRDVEEEAEETLDIGKFLTGFCMADSSERFKRALGALSVEIIPLRFDFPESYFDLAIRRERLLSVNFAQLAGQVVVRRGEVRLRVAIQELGDQEEEDERHGQGVRIW